MEKVTFVPPTSKGKVKEKKETPKEETVLEKDETIIEEEEEKEEPIIENEEKKEEEIIEEDKEHVNSTTEIDPEEQKDIKGEKIKVNFVDKDFMKKYARKKTVEGAEKEEEKKDDYFKGKTTKDIEEQIKREASDPSNQFTPQEMQDFAETFMDIIDMGISTGLRFYARDTSTSEYEIPADKKKRLVRQLTILLVKYQAKFSLEFMFIVSLCIAYSVPAKKARDRRRNPVVRGPGKPKK